MTAQPELTPMPAATMASTPPATRRRPTALVTGATAGIGLEFARQLAAGGHDLVIVARDSQRLDDVAAELAQAHGTSVEVISADLSDRAAVQRVAERLGDPDRPVDLLVNNAGFGRGRRFVGGDLAAEEQLVDVLIRAVLVLSHAAANAMRERGHGAIINVSSVAGWVSMGTYSAAKSWVTTFTEGLASELAGSGVSATALCPGFVHTEFHERAGIRMGFLPGWAWLDADHLVRGALADARRGKVVSVPGMKWKVASLASRTAPRPIVRRASSRIAHRRSRG